MRLAVLTASLTLAWSAPASAEAPVFVSGSCDQKLARFLDALPPDQTFCGHAWNASVLIGVPLELAREIAERRGNLFRALYPDIGITLDLMPRRIDVEVRRGRVASVAAY